MLRRSAAILGILAMLLQPQGPRAFGASPRPELGALADWVAATGKLHEVDPALAVPLGLGTGPIAVRQRAFRTEDQLIHVVALAEGGKGEILLALFAPDRTGYVWRTTRYGVLLVTLHQAPGGIEELVPNLEAAAEFRAEKGFFLARLAAGG